VPILRDGDISIYETSAIIRYLDEVGTGPSLLPSTPETRATMEQWISAINCYMYDTLVRGYAFSYIGARIAGRDPDPEQIRAAVPNMERDLGRLDGAYARHAYIAGDAPSLADLLVAPIIQTVSMFPEGKRAVAAAGNLSRAYAKLSARTSFESVHAGMPG
jgi:glutathione S-transferase